MGTKMPTQAIQLEVTKHHVGPRNIQNAIIIQEAYQKGKILNLASANPVTGLPLTGLLSLSIGERDLSLKRMTSRLFTLEMFQKL